MERRDRPYWIDQEFSLLLAPVWKLLGSVSIGVASDDVTVVVFIDKTGEKLLAEISEARTKIFKYKD